MITTHRLKMAIESMTENRSILELLSFGIVQGISKVVQPPCEDPNPF